MRRPLLLATAFLLGGVAVAADPPKETLAASYTRTKKLKGKVSLDLKDVTLSAALKELSEALEDAKLGALGVQFAAGVPSEGKVTYSAKDVPAEDALDAVLRPLDLGFAVVSKEKDRSDGWVTITKGAKPPTGPVADPEDERLAQAQLDVAKKLLADGKADRAKTVLTFVAKKYPDTKAAREAKTLLGKADK